MFYFSKSRYCLAWQCPKLLWLSKNKPELKPEDPALQARFNTGNIIGDMAMSLFGEYTEVTTLKEDGSLDLNRMQQLTKECIENGIENICEASFNYNGLYCAVDILRKTDTGYAIYEVKSSSSAKHIYAVDISYQKYVLEKCGLNITGAYVVCINSEYIRKKELDIHNFFKIIDVWDEVINEQQNVSSLLKKAESIYAMKDEPIKDIGMHCRDPYDCAFWDYCTSHLPKPNVFDLYRMNFNIQLKYYYAGKISFDQLLYDTNIKNEKQIMQMLHATEEREPYILKSGIADFLDTLSYPLYFLDFESMQMTIPEYEGTVPNQQIPFQYSLHYIEHEGAPLQHKEFLAESGTDPRRAIAERLCEDIPRNACILAYYKGFECNRLTELANAFPDLSEHLLDIRSNVVDLLKPFQSGYYYTRAMGGSFSIKSVLPALFPDDPELDYHNLEDIHNGTEAMNIYPLIKDMSPEEQAHARKNLLEYCKLDTLAMVKVWQKLKEVIN